MRVWWAIIHWSTCVYCSQWLCAQSLENDDALISEVVIVEKRHLADSSHFLLSNESTDPVRSLWRNLPVYLRSQYPGGLQTISLRGQSPQHVPILWHGLNLQNPMNGVFDLSLIPVLAYQYGLATDNLLPDQYRGIGFSAKKPSKERSYKIYGSVGSFQQGRLSAEWSRNKKNFSYRLFTDHHTAKNNFPYRDLTQVGRPWATTKHAAIKINHYGSDLWYESERDTFEVHFLYTQACRQIPPSMTEAYVERSQRDTSLKLSINYGREVLGIKVGVQHGIVYDRLNYEQLSHHTFMSLSHVQLIKDIDNVQQWRLKYYLLSEVARSSSFEKRVSRLNHMVEGGYQLALEKFGIHFSFNCQGSFQDGMPPFFGYNAVGQFLKSGMEAYIKAGTTHRRPTINDHFWPLSGNTSLLPETTYFILAKVGMPLLQKENYQFSFELDPEYKTIKNFIQWVPQGGFLWRPENVFEVRAYTCDFTLKQQISMSKDVVIIGKTYYQWQRVLNTKILHSSQSDALGKQVMYMPIHQGGIQCRTLMGPNWIIDLGMQYIGYRFTSRDNTTSLDPFFLVHFGFGRLAYLRNLGIHISMNIENVTNQTYQLVAFRQMPGRVFQLSFIFFNSVK